MKLSCQGLNSSCTRPAAPCHAPLLPRWLQDIPAALRRSAHEESVMEWLSETPGSFPHCTPATLLLLQPLGQTPKSGEGCSLVCQFTNRRQHRWWCLQRRPVVQQGLGWDGELLEGAQTIHGLGCYWYPPGRAHTGSQQMTSRSPAALLGSERFQWKVFLYWLVHLR